MEVDEARGTASGATTPADTCNSSMWRAFSMAADEARVTNAATTPADTA